MLVCQNPIELAKTLTPSQVTRKPNHSVIKAWQCLAKKSGKPIKLEIALTILIIALIILILLNK